MRAWEINYDGTESCIESVNVLLSQIDDSTYFARFSDAKKSLLSYLKERRDEFDYAVQRIRKTKASDFNRS